MQFLFERLATVTVPATGLPEPFDLAAAVAAQVQRIVGVRPAAADGEPGLLAFGMAPVVDLAANSRSQLERYARQLERLIAHYEPRLRQPVVTLQDTGGALQPWRLVVSGQLAADGAPHSFSFDLPAH